MSNPKLIIVVDGGVVQNVLTDTINLGVDVHLLNYDDLFASKGDPAGLLELEVDPKEVALVISGKHPSIKAMKSTELT